MHLFPLIAVAIVLLAGETVEPGAVQSSGRAWSIVAAAAGPVLLMVLGAGLGVRWAHRRALRRHSVDSFLAAHRIVRNLRAVLLVHHALSIWILGLLEAIRLLIGDLVFLDELLAVLPPLLGAVASFWIVHPVEMTARQATTIRRLDDGLVPLELPGRAAFVLRESRSYLGPLLVPMLLVMLVGELVRPLAEAMPTDEAAAWARHGGTVLGGLLVLLFAPSIVRWALRLRPLAPGPTREAMLEVCRRHRVRVRDVMVWHTDARMINAAVMGMLPRIRYVLLTDALLETVPDESLVAVMAHEVGHVRRHHMPWIILAVGAAIVVGSVLAWLPVAGLDRAGLDTTLPWIGMVQGFLSVIAAFVVFGWTSRRFERQADVFAVQHLSRWPLAGPGTPPEAAPPAADRVSPRAVATMNATLGIIDRLNRGVAGPGRSDRTTAGWRRLLREIGEGFSSWRHGTIDARQRHLAAIVSRPLDRLPIDAQVRLIKAAAVAILAVSVAVAVLDRAPTADAAGDDPAARTAAGLPTEDAPT